MLAEKMIHFKDFQTDATCVPGCIVWKMDDNSKRVYVNHFYGSEELRLPGGTYYILPLAAIEEFESDYPESTSYIHVYLNKIIDPVEAQN
jgi:hypothetical protein